MDQAREQEEGDATWEVVDAVMGNSVGEDDDDDEGVGCGGGRGREREVVGMGGERSGL